METMGMQGDLYRAARAILEMIGEDFRSVFDAVNDLATAIRKTFTPFIDQMKWSINSIYSAVIYAYATPRERHYMRNSKKIRTRQKYWARVARRYREEVIQCRRTS